MAVQQADAAGIELAFHREAVAQKIFSGDAESVKRAAGAKAYTTGLCLGGKHKEVGGNEKKEKPGVH